MAFKDRTRAREYGREWIRACLKNPARRQRHRDQTRASVARWRQRRLNAGLTTKGTPPVRSRRRVGACYTEGAAAYSKALQRWIRNDTGISGRWWHATRGKIWNWRGFTDSERWRTRYRLDDQFRAAEVFKAQTLKAARAARIASTDDGSITVSALCVLFADAVHCPYCMEHMASVDKSLDHVQPLMRGGAHSLENVVVCCKPCNYSKGRKLLIAWLFSGPSRGVAGRVLATVA